MVAGIRKAPLAKSRECFDPRPRSDDNDDSRGCEGQPRLLPLD